MADKINDLVDRGILIEKITERYKYSFGDAHIMASHILDIVYDAPTVEAEPARHGRWDFTSCSLCGHSFLEYAEADCDKSIYTELPNFCPFCGAKMDEGADT